MPESPQWSVCARASLAGNPSDGYGGAVCAVVVPEFVATATVVDRGAGSDAALVTATIDRFYLEAGLDAISSVAISSTIPRSIGLAGSSAIVIATIRALSNHTGIQLTDDDVAVMAHTVEREDLNIAGGWQDQLIQSRGTSGLMDFSDGRRSHRRLDIATEPPLPLYVAWSPDAAEPSDRPHTQLQRHVHVNNAIIDELAALAHGAADALERRNVHELKAAIDATFDARSRLMPLAPKHRAMVEATRALGAAANFTGSGGAIIGVLPKDGERFVAAMRRQSLQVHTWPAQ